MSSIYHLRGAVRCAYYASMLVCSCRAVTDRTICAAIAAGADTIDDVARMCTAGSRCGGCWPQLQRMLAESVTVGKTDAHHAA